jgi:hypothetical protein
MTDETETQLSPDDREALLDLAMWQKKLASLASVSTRRRWRNSSAAQAPAHSAPFYVNVAGFDFRWEATDGSERGGAIGIRRGDWFQKDPGYGFAPDMRAMIADTHNDQAMAFLVYRDGESIDEACVVGAAAGEEGEAQFIAGSMGSYVRRAVEARFGNYWFLRDAHAHEARAWVDAQPLDPTPRFEVHVEAAGAADAVSLRALAVAWLPASVRKRIAAAAGFKGDDPAGIAAALVAALGGKPAAVKKLGETIERATHAEPWRKNLLLGEIDPDLRAVRLHVKRVGTAYLPTSRFNAAVHAVQLLLDAPGADALARAVNLDHVRFCAERKYAEAQKVVSLAFAREPDKTLPRGKVPGEIDLLALLPAALVPTGCIAGARFASIAPGTDGVTSDGKVLKSA